MVLTSAIELFPPPTAIFGLLGPRAEAALTCFSARALGSSRTDSYSTLRLKEADMGRVPRSMASPKLLPNRDLVSSVRAWAAAMFVVGTKSKSQGGGGPALFPDAGVKRYKLAKTAQ